ncbi:MAG: hypothetical protein KDD19_05875 [Phaeodactylibacter sp.]|nr:hypothetical protein [Phaeodactylibacter sp.]MCB9048310.1 hypothetical protein [Lewinellaceae bacterium]
MTRIIVLLMFICLILTCNDSSTGEQLQPVDPTITVTTDLGPADGLCVGQVIKFTLELRSDPLAGIESLVIRKNGSEIARETSFSLANVNFSFDYKATNADLDVGEASFEFILTDNRQKIVSETAVIKVVTEFGFLVEGIQPRPSLNIVTNNLLDIEDGAEVDIRLVISSEGCGAGCLNYKYTFVSGNGTRFYDVPFGGIVNIYENQMKQADVLTAVEGLPELEEIVVYSEFVEDFSPNSGVLNRFPIVAKIRGKEEFAVIDKAPGIGAFSYRKRGEFAGE